MLELFGVFMHSSVAHDMCTPALYDCTRTHKAWKKALIWAREVAVGTYASSGYEVDGGTRTRDPGNRCSSCGLLVRQPVQENSTAHAATHQTARKRVNDLPCVVKRGVSAQLWSDTHLCFPLPPPAEVFLLKAGRLTGLLARIQNATWRMAEVRTANTQQVGACRHGRREATLCMDVR